MSIKEKIAPRSFLGVSNTAIRQQDDFYATPVKATEALLDTLNNLNINLPNLILEPSIGNGLLANVLINKGHSVIGYDIVDRGFPNTIIKDFMAVNERPEENIAIIANYPYKYILEHTKHSLDLLRDGEYLCSLAKIQFLETKSRRELFDESPMKYVCVFSERVKCLANGKETEGSSAVCYCWYIWKKGFSGRPEILWI